MVRLRISPIPEDMGSSLLIALAICLLINFLCPERRAGVKNVRRLRTKISIIFYNVERNIDQELRVDLTPLNGWSWPDVRHKSERMSSWGMGSYITISTSYIDNFCSPGGVLIA